MDSGATYRVEGMSYAHCETAVRAELAEVAGIERVEVDVLGGLVRVHGPAAPAAIREAILEAGYEPTAPTA